MVFITTHIYHVIETNRSHGIYEKTITLYFGSSLRNLDKELCCTRPGRQQKRNLSHGTRIRLSSSVINTNLVTSLILQEKYLSRFLLLLLADDSSGSSSPSSFPCHGDSTPWDSMGTSPLKSQPLFFPQLLDASFPPPSTFSPQIALWIISHVEACLFIMGLILVIYSSWVYFLSSCERSSSAESKRKTRNLAREK